MRLLCGRIDPPYCIAIVFINLNVFFIEVSLRLNFVSSIFMEGECVVPLAPAVMTISGSTFHPCWMTLLISGWYFCILLLIVSGENLSLVYVNLINCIVRLSSGFCGGSFWCGRPLMHNMSGLNLALHIYTNICVVD